MARPSHPQHHPSSSSTPTLAGTPTPASPSPSLRSASASQEPIHNHEPLTREEEAAIPIGAGAALAIAESNLDDVETSSAATRVGEDDEVDGADGAKSAPLPKKQSQSTDTEKGELEHEEWTYPDGGLKAWGVVLGAHIFACCQMGYGMTWGVMVANLMETTYTTQSSATLNLIAGLSNFVMSGSALVAGRLAERYGYKRMIGISTVCSFVSLLLSAAAYKSLAGIFICQGVLIGASLGLGTPIYLSIPSQWFLKRRGLATGLTAAGTGVGGGASSLIIRFLLPAVGYGKTLTIYGAINFAMCCFAWTLLEVRLPPLKAGESRVPKNWLPVGMGRDPALYSMVLCVFVGTFGYLVVPYFATDYTLFKNPSMNPNSILPAVPLIVGNFMQGIGRVGAGFVADRIGPVNAFFLSYFAGGLIQIVMWPHVSSLGAITAFTVLFNLLGAWYMVLLPVTAAQLFGVKGLATITGLLLVANSPGQFLGGTIAGAVLDSGAGYDGVAYYAGACMLAGAVILLFARFHREKRVFARF